MNLRIARTTAYVAIGITIAGLLGIFGINLQENAYFIPWKFVLVGCMGYLVWFINRMLHF